MLTRPRYVMAGRDLAGSAAAAMTEDEIELPTVSGVPADTCMHQRHDWFAFVAVTAGFSIAFAAARGALDFELTSPWFVLVSMICFLGWMSTARPLFLPRLPRWLGTVRAWEGRRGLYRMLGVPAFGAMLRRTPLRLLNLDVYLSLSHRDPAGLEAQLEAAEAAHLLDAVLVVPYMAYASVQGWWAVVSWFVILQLAVNVYPILHLRTARGRLQRALGLRVLPRRPGRWEA
jgi:hypothetical protein